MPSPAAERGPLPERPPGAAGTRYDGEAGARDLRIDFLRGLVMATLLVVHVEVFSAFSLLAWERAGLISGAEGFVILSGLVIGMVQRQTLAREGRQAAVDKLLARAAQLWRVNVAVIGAIALVLLFVPFLDAAAVTTFTDRGAQKVYDLYPKGAPPPTWIAKAAVLQMGPHQIQILGLYVVLLAASPLAIFAFSRGKTRYVLGLSWLLYCLNVASPMRPTLAQFEYGFPLLAWQLLWFHGMAVGWHREAVLAFFEGPRGRVALAIAVGAFGACFFVAQNHTNPFAPAWAQIRVLPAPVFDWLYAEFFHKNGLGLGRLLNDAAALVVAYAALTRWWRPLHRAFGWFFVPIGQATLYVFVVHVFLILAITQVWPFGLDQGRWIANTALHAGVLAAVWLMVRFRVLYRWIPR